MLNYGLWSNIIIYGQVIGGTLVAIIGVFVYARNRKSRIHNTLSKLCLCFSVILFGSVGLFLSKNNPTAIFFDRLVYVGVVFVPTLTYHFALEFTSSKKKFKKILYLGYTISFIFLGLIRSDYFLDGIYKYRWGLHMIARPLHHVFLIFMFTYFVLFFLTIYRFYKERAKGISKTQVRYIFLAFFILAVIGPTGFLPAYQVTVYPYAYYGWVVFAILLAYVIIKHRLMDIRLLMLKSVAYTLTLGVVAGGYVALTVFVFQIFEGIINTTILHILTLFVLVLSFQPLRKFIEQHTDQLFSKGRYNFRELLGKINDISKKNSRSISGTSIKILKALIDDMRVSKAAIVFTNNSYITEIKALGYESKSMNLWKRPVKIAVEHAVTIVYDELEEDSVEKNILRTVDIEVLVPILSEQEALFINEKGMEVEKKGIVQAVLALGPKKSGDMYTSEDLKLLELAAPQLALAFENAKSFKEKEQRITELKSINKMFQRIEQFINLDSLLKQIVNEAIKVTDADGGSLMLLNKSGKNLSIKTAKNLHPLIPMNTKINVGEGIAGYVAKTGESVIINGLRDKKFAPYLKRYDIVSAISVPLKTGDKLIGVLNINRKKQKREFTEENLNVITAFAAQAAEAIEKAGYYQKVERLSFKKDRQFRELTKSLAKTVDAKDPYTYGHSEAVTNYALEIAKEMGYKKQKLRTLEIGGRLHDIGKIGIPEHILNKAGSLTDDEFYAIKRHPEIGADILKDTSYLKGIRDIILYHHERFDGKGYPTGLKGKNIPIFARILAVADAFDAMTSHRAYRKAMSRATAYKEIIKNNGSQFDPKIVEAFIKVFNKKRMRLIKNTAFQEAYSLKVKKVSAKYNFHKKKSG